jgi:hypothetical protein
MPWVWALLLAAVQPATRLEQRVFNVGADFALRVLTRDNRSHVFTVGAHENLTAAFDAFSLEHKLPPSEQHYWGQVHTCALTLARPLPSPPR